MEKVQKLTDQLETGITELFNSERYAAYLSTMAKFHRYSFGNILLILLQCPGASQVAGYGDWKKNFWPTGQAGRAWHHHPRPLPLSQARRSGGNCPGRFFQQISPVGTAHELSDSYRVRHKPDRGETAARKLPKS